jgi:formamidopyrimidine-DNA glycosylase
MGAVPELPDITVYVERIAERTAGATLRAIRLASPFLLRSVDPRVDEVVGRAVTGVSRLGKRIVIELEGARFVVLHLMVAGRLQWEAPGAKIPGRVGAAAFDFEAKDGATGSGSGALLLTEASSKKRASLHLVRGAEALAAMNPGGVEPLAIDRAAFADALRRERHTLKRSLTDPRLFSGIGNAYSDEILHRARLSPLALSTSLSDDEIGRLHDATVSTLVEWTDRLRAEAAANGGWPKKVTAFHDEMAVHGRYGKPCPVCGEKVQRIAYAENETNYCARCQTERRLLADRGLSRLLKDDWPKTVQELEELVAAKRG